MEDKFYMLLQLRAMAILKPLLACLCNLSNWYSSIASIACTTAG